MTKNSIEVKLKILVLLALHLIKLVKKWQKVNFIDIKLFLNGYCKVSINATYILMVCPPSLLAFVFVYFLFKNFHKWLTIQMGLA